MAVILNQIQLNANQERSHQPTLQHPSMKTASPGLQRVHSQESWQNHHSTIYHHRTVLRRLVESLGFMRMENTYSLLICVEIDTSAFQSLLSDEVDSGVEFSQFMMRTAAVA